MGVVIDIRRARSDRNAAKEIRRARSDRNSNNPAKLYGYPYFTFYLEEMFCAHRDDHGIAQ